MEYTDEKINEIANDFFKNNRFEKAKISGFKAGFKKALSLFAVSGSVAALPQRCRCNLIHDTCDCKEENECSECGKPLR